MDIDGAEALVDLGEEFVDLVDIDVTERLEAEVLDGAGGLAERVTTERLLADTLGDALNERDD